MGSNIKFRQLQLDFHCCCLLMVSFLVIEKLINWSEIDRKTSLMSGGKMSPDDDCCLWSTCFVQLFMSLEWIQVQGEEFFEAYSSI